MSESWQVQAQTALARADQLTELLTEGAQWLASPRAQARASASAAASAHSDAQAGSAPQTSARAAAPQSQAQDETPANGTGVVDATAPTSGTVVHVTRSDLAAADLDADLGNKGGAHADAQEQSKLGARCQHCGEKDAEAARHVAHASELDVQLRALQMEVLRATQMSAQVGRSVLPALYSIEARLVEGV